MRRLLRELQDTLTEFVDQSDHALLVLGSEDAEVAYGLKVLEALDGENEADVVLVFAQPVEGDGRYAEALVEEMRGQIEAINALRESEGRPPWPPLPPRSFDPAASAGLRVRGALSHLRDQLPEGDHRLVCALLPLTIADRGEYLSVLRALYPSREVQPWMRRMRVIARDLREAPFVLREIHEAQLDRVLAYAPDLSAAAMRVSIAGELRDPEAPTAERMQAMMQLAMMDYGEERHEEAMDKYATLFNYYSQHQAPAMQGMCLGGIGECLHRLGRSEEARARLRQGLALAAPTSALAVTMNLAMGAARVDRALGELEEAVGYYVAAERIAATISSPYLRAQAAYEAGLVERQRGDRASALLHLGRAAQQCREIQYQEKLAQALEQSLQLHREVGEEDRAAALESELRAVRASLDPAFTSVTSEGRAS